MMIGRIIGLRFVRLYRSRERLSRTRILIALHSRTFYSMHWLIVRLTSRRASSISASDSRT